jgi:hypothetical protein
MTRDPTLHKVFVVHGASKSNNTQGDIDEKYPDRNPE